MKLYSVLMAKVMPLLIESQQLQNKVLRRRGNITTKDEEIETLGYWSRNITELKLRKATSTTRSYCIAQGTIFTILYNKPDRKEIINYKNILKDKRKKSNLPCVFLSTRKKKMQKGLPRCNEVSVSYNLVFRFKSLPSDPIR